jgi:hypothetical protein
LADKLGIIWCTQHRSADYSTITTVEITSCPLCPGYGIQHRADTTILQQFLRFGLRLLRAAAGGGSLLI